MLRPLAAASLVLVLALASSPARADVVAEVANGDRITGTLDPAGETETFRVRVPKGAAITVKAKAATKGLVLDVALSDPAEAPLDAASGTAPSIRGVPAASSGVHTVTVASSGGAVKGDYALAITWKSVASFGAAPSLAAAATGQLEFAADAGAVATFTVRPGKGSGATAALDELTLPGGSVVPFAGRKVTRTLAAGDHVLSFANTGAADGVVAATVKLKLPKFAKRKIVLTSSVIGAGGPAGGAAVAAIVGSAGGTVTFPDLPPDEPGAAIAGSSVEIPAGALGAGTAIVIATAPDLDVPGAATGAGPAVHFGPDGLSFTSVDKDAEATITIPYDPALTEEQAASLIVYTRDAKGRVTAVPGPYAIVASAHTLSFPTSHFSAYQAAGVGFGGQSSMFTIGRVASPEDVCLAFDDSTETPIAYLVAEGAAATVAGLRFSGSTLVHERETFAGGGAESADDGTVSRLDFEFPGPVVSVHAISDGRVFVATPRIVYQIGADDFVTRIAGTGAAGDTGDFAAATAATFTSIASVLADDDGTVIIADAGAHRIRTVLTFPAGIILPYAGTGVAALGADGVPLNQTTFLGPADLEFSEDESGVYVADGARVRLLVPGQPGETPDVNVTIAGDVNGATGSSGDGGSLLAARFGSISGVSRYLDPLNPLPSVSSLVVTDEDDDTVRLLDRVHDRVILAAGQHGAAGDAPDISPASGLLRDPTSVFGGAGNIVFTDRDNGKVRLRIAIPLE